MQKILLSVLMLITGLAARACPTCEIAQPKYLKGISHGGGPQGQWDLVIISVTAVIVVATLFFSIKFLVRQGEKSGTHIKHVILNRE